MPEKVDKKKNGFKNFRKTFHGERNSLLFLLKVYFF